MANEAKATYHTYELHVWSYLPVNIGKVLLHPHDVTRFLEEERHC